MAEAAWDARSAFACVTGASHDPSAGLVVERLDDGALARLASRRGLEAVLALLVRRHYGIELPSGPAVASHDGIAFIGIAPEAWMVIGVELEALAQSLGTAASLFDWSDSRALLQLSGPRVRDTLAKGLPVDLHPRVFRSGCVAVTRIGHIGVTLWQIDAAPRFKLAVPRSYAGDLLHWLLQAGAEYGTTLN
jgi:sarcosine oxidase subunit gamma